MQKKLSSSGSDLATYRLLVHWFTSCLVFQCYFGLLAFKLKIFFLLSVNQMMMIFWVVMLSFFMSHWEKYNTGVLYLPWAYDFSQVVSHC